MGWNVGVGEKLRLDATLMAGGVFGNTNGVAPGYELTVSWGPLELYSEGEYVFDLEDSEGDFFYNWAQLGYSPWELADGRLRVPAHPCLRDGPRRPARPVRRVHLQEHDPGRLRLQRRRPAADRRDLALRLVLAPGAEETIDRTAKDDVGHDRQQDRHGHGLLQVKGAEEYPLVQEVDHRGGDEDLPDVAPALTQLLAAAAGEREEGPQVGRPAFPRVPQPRPDREGDGDERLQEQPEPPRAGRAAEEVSPETRQEFVDPRILSRGGGTLRH